MWVISKITWNDRWSHVPLFRSTNILKIYDLNKCIGDDTKDAARQSPNCIKKNKIWRKTIFNMADGLLTSCNVARSWHWFRQVTAPCNVACGSGIMTVNSPSGSTLQCDTSLWDDVPLNSPVAAPCNVTCNCGMTCHWIRPNVRHIGILHLVSISTISLLSTCHSAPVCEILSKSDHPRQKKMTSCRFSRRRISAILDFMGPVMGSLKSPCTTSYRSIDIIALNCLVFEKIAFLHFGDRPTDRQTDKTNRWTASMH